MFQELSGLIILLDFLEIPSIVGIYMPLSGKELLKRYLKNGWVLLRKNGSHFIVGKGEHRETIPMHKELKKGLEIALLKRLEKEK